MHLHDHALDVSSYIYFGKEHKQDEKDSQIDLDTDQILSRFSDKLLDVIGREVLKEKTLTLQELEYALEAALPQSAKPNNPKKETKQPNADLRPNYSKTGMHLPIIAELIQSGYIKDDTRWLTSKAFVSIGEKILKDLMRSLKKGGFGLHETNSLGNGSVILDTTKRYETGNDIKLLNVPVSLLNAVQRITRHREQPGLPLQITSDDFEEFETIQEVRVAVVYCIDLSSTMRYSAMYGSMSRIEAAKRALWGIVTLNRKFFPMDSIYIIGFGALASKINANDIPYLKTFEPGADLLHYTNYQAAFRLATKILQKDTAPNKRIVLITDGHPSACFIEDNSEYSKILSKRPHSYFYTPDNDALEFAKTHLFMNLDVTSNKLVYLCYRYKQVDQYIGDKTISEAKRCHRRGVDIDTVMISEDDSLLGYVNDLERAVKGRSYYLNPDSIDRILLTDYLYKKKLIMI